jgi:DNA helicase-2/ATP-dependent DNA helicase PcrA
VRFYQRLEIKDMLAYLKAIHNPKDNVSYMRIINVPHRGIGAATVEQVNAYAVENDISFSAALNELEQIPGLKTRSKKLKSFVTLMDGLTEFAQGHTVYEVIQKVLADTGYSLNLLAQETEEANNRVENIEELLSAATEYGQEHPHTGEGTALGDFLEEVALVADIDNYDENEDAASLMTLHSAKGLEFPCVFLVGVEEGIFPSFQSIMNADKTKLEEERRLCYVGITRAKKELYVTTARQRFQRGEIVANAPSRFLKELPPNCVQVL